MYVFWFNRFQLLINWQKITLILIFFHFLLACWGGRASCWCFKCSHRVARQCPGCWKDSVWEPTGPTYLLHRVLCRGQGNTSKTKTHLACLYVCCFVRHWLHLQKRCLQSFCMNYTHVWYCRENNSKKWWITRSNILNIPEPVFRHLLNFGHLCTNVS